MATGRVDGRTAREINNVIRYTAWSVFRSARPLAEADRNQLAAEVDQLIDGIKKKEKQ